MHAKAILFDLFGTVVHFSDRLPTLHVGSESRRSALGWLREPAARECPEINFDELLARVLEVTKEISRSRAPEYVEVSSAERFRRALLRLGFDVERAAQVAPRLSAAHMQHIASLTFLPAGSAETLRELARRYRLGLVSNFDDGATARRILATHAVAEHFSAVVISDGFGRRKPHPSIFAACLHELGVEPADAVFVGDSHGDDVVGARAAGLRVIWIAAEPSGAELEPQPDARITALPELLSHFD